MVIKGSIKFTTQGEKSTVQRVGLIYLSKNKINNKIYIGQTIQTLEKRKRRHENDALSNSDHVIFHRALKKYGIENFEWSVLESNIEEKFLNDKEKYYIKKYKSNDPDIGYNMTPRGESRPTSHYILNNDLVLEIIDMIKNTQKTFKEIGELYGVSMYAISDINRGRSWTQQNIKYPIREPHKSSISREYKKVYKGSLSKEIVEKIIKDLKDTYLTNTEIAKKYNVSKLSIASVNNGKNLLARDMNDIFPIRKEKIDINNKLIKNRANMISDILDPTIPYCDIEKKYRVNHSTLKRINEGTLLFNNNLNYPLREKTISLNRNKKLTLDDVKVIYELLEKTDLSFRKIGELFNVSKRSIGLINQGKIWSYVYENQTFPIRK